MDQRRSGRRSTVISDGRAYNGITRGGFAPKKRIALVYVSPVLMVARMMAASG